MTAPPEREGPSVDRTREMLRQREQREHDAPSEPLPAPEEGDGDEQPGTGEPDERQG